ncbi:hypothetical protein DSO57_1004983 [Entomophthora muscae]|uniref:Uncharacterized protein n=1 Tax=Entomophthora muscae TaxID=34485 RepID=A0ACC2SX30_9FUNG|nr:hypothetical protein DSO57_1004983 [Entomophthora muscae]
MECPQRFWIVEISIQLTHDAGTWCNKWHKEHMEENWDIFKQDFLARFALKDTTLVIIHQAQLRSSPKLTKNSDYVPPQIWLLTLQLPILCTIIATEFPDLPANISYSIQGALTKSPLDVSNDMNQSDGIIKLGALSPN